MIRAVSPSRASMLTVSITSCCPRRSSAWNSMPEASSICRAKPSDMKALSRPVRDRSRGLSSNCQPSRWRRGRLTSARTVMPVGSIRRAMAFAPWGTLCDVMMWVLRLRGGSKEPRRRPAGSVREPRSVVPVLPGFSTKSPSPKPCPYVSLVLSDPAAQAGGAQMFVYSSVRS